MGEIGEVLRVEDASDADGHATDVVCDPGGGTDVTAELALPPGVDAKPLPGDFAAVERARGAGRGSVAGFFDPKSESKSANGEHRIYARDAEGNTVAEFWLKGNGEIQITNFREHPITIKSEGQIIFDSDDISLGKNASRNLAGVGDYILGSFSVAAAAQAILAPNPSGSIKFAGQIVSGFRRAKG